MASPRSLLILLAACGGEGGGAPDAVDASVAADAVLDGPSTSFNGCTPASALDATAIATSRVIATTEEEAYDPPCLRIARGQSVTWNGEFEMHPLAPGIVGSGTIVGQPGSPISMTASGFSTEVTFAAAGAWGFYCTNHVPSMAGVVYVDP